MKKVLHILLCMTLFASVCLPASANELSDKQLSTLYEYGIFQGDESGELNLDKNITRAEFCKVVLSSLGYSKDVLREFDDIEDFIDVEESHWAYLYIHNAQKLSLIDGYGNGYFAPESNINMNEVIKIIINSLGYESQAQELGGYPEGYISVANKLGLTKNIEYATEEVAVREEVASIIYTALDIPLMQRVEFGDRIVYKVMDGTEDSPLITWNLRFKGEVANDNLLQAPDKSNSDAPRFNGSEYTGRIVKISNLNKIASGYTFKNSLNSEDDSTYIINDNTYVYISNNTVELDKIRIDMYAQCWYYTDDSGEIEILKIELMREKPAGI